MWIQRIKAREAYTVYRNESNADDGRPEPTGRGSARKDFMNLLLERSVKKAS